MSLILRLKEEHGLFARENPRVDQRKTIHRHRHPCIENQLGDLVAALMKCCAQQLTTIVMAPTRWERESWHSS